MSVGSSVLCILDVCTYIMPIPCHLCIFVLVEALSGETNSYQKDKKKGEKAAYRRIVPKVLAITAMVVDCSWKRCAFELLYTYISPNFNAMSYKIECEYWGKKSRFVNKNIISRADHVFRCNKYLAHTTWRYNSIGSEVNGLEAMRIWCRCTPPKFIQTWIE